MLVHVLCMFILAICKETFRKQIYRTEHKAITIYMFQEWSNQYNMKTKDKCKVQICPFFIQKKNLLDQFVMD